MRRAAVGGTGSLISRRVLWGCGAGRIGRVAGTSVLRPGPSPAPGAPGHPAPLEASTFGPGAGERSDKSRVVLSPRWSRGAAGRWFYGPGGAGDASPTERPWLLLPKGFPPASLLPRCCFGFAGSRLAGASRFRKRDFFSLFFFSFGMFFSLDMTQCRRRATREEKSLRKEP